MLIKSMVFHLVELTFAVQNILTRENYYHIDIVPFFRERYIRAAMQE